VKRLCIGLLGLCLVAVAPSLRAGKLDQVRDAVHEEDDATEESAETEQGEYYDEGDDDGVLAELALLLLEMALEAESSEAEITAPAPRTPGRSDLQLASEYKYDLDGVHRPSITARWYPSTHFGLDTSLLHYIEIERQGIDQLLLGDANLLARFWLHPAVVLRLGGGAAWLYDRPHVDVGFNVTAGVDVMLIEELVLSGRTDVGRIGNATVLHGCASLGYKLHAAEIYLGYDVRGFAGMLTVVGFHGPVAGLRAWF